MQKKTISVYAYSELSEKAKEKASEYYFSNVDMMGDDGSLQSALLSLSDGEGNKDGILQYSTVCGRYPESGLQVKRGFILAGEKKREEYAREFLAEYLEDGESISQSIIDWMRSQTFETFVFNHETKNREKKYVYVGEFLDDANNYIVGLSIEDEIRTALQPDESKNTWDIFDYLEEVCTIWNTHIRDTLEYAESEAGISEYFDSNDYTFLFDGTIDRY